MSGERQINNQTLYSWKEIAVFLKCGVRTAQRWERNENLPTHRHSHIRRGTVYAFKDEIQEWMKSREGSQTIPPKASANPVPISVPPVQLDRLYHLCEQARERAGRVRGVFQLSIDASASCHFPPLRSMSKPHFDVSRLLTQRSNTATLLQRFLDERLRPRIAQATGVAKPL